MIALPLRSSAYAGCTLLLLAAACASPASMPAPGGTPAPALSDRAALVQLIDSLTAEPVWRNAHWGIVIVDPARSDTLYSRNAGKLFMPASNQKLLTGAVALARLGPDYRFSTQIGAATSGPVAAGSNGDDIIRDGVIDGDLVVTGSGDPTVSDHARTDAMLPLHEVASALRARGLRRVTGRLVADGDALVGPALGYGWAWDDLDFPYSAGVDALTFNEGFTRIVVHGGSVAGEAPRIRTAPAATYPTVRVEAQTVADSADRPRLHVLPGDDAHHVVVRGTIMAGDSAVLRMAHRDPRAAFLAALQEALAAQGIVVDQGIGGSAPAGIAVVPLAGFESPPLSEILVRLQKPSQNQIAELLYRTLGREGAGVGSADSGRVVVERTLQSWGISRDDAVVRDGSGLSRHNYVTPEAVVRVLDAMRRAPTYALFHASLPIAGVDGTIANRMRGTPAEGNVHAKTGFIDRARSLSGYVTTADGTPLLFSFLANNWTTPVREVERVQDAIAAHLAGMRLRE